MIGSVVPDDMNEAFVGVARLDLGEKLREDMGPDRRCGAAEASLQPFAQFCFLAQMSFETDPFSSHRRTTHPSQPRDSSCTRPECCRHQGRETRQWPGMTSRCPATGSHWQDAQQHDPRADDAQKPLVHDGPRLKENQGGSCVYLNRYRQPRQPIKSRVFRESVYIGKD